MKFIKPPETIEQLVDRLRRRGMTVRDEAKACHYLKHLNYYRLAAYWLPFEADHATHRFKPGADFDEVLNLYMFDRELRLLVLDAIERIEVSIRALYAYHLAHRYGPHPHLRPDIHRQDGDAYRFNKERLAEEVRRSNETFIRHLLDKYDEDLPCIWAAVEVMSLGQISRWYAGLKARRDRKMIADEYGMDEQVLRSFLHHLTTVRNLCAHHARLWNREFTFTPRLPKRPAHLARSLNAAAPRRMYNTLTMMSYLLDIICPGHHFRQRLLELMEKHHIAPGAMGFPDGWRELPIWKEAKK